MKKQLYLLILFMFLIGCSNKNTFDLQDDTISLNNIETIEQIVEEPTPIPTIDPYVKIQDGEFVLYFNGMNNYMDDMSGYEKIDIVPDIYNNYETLLNHSDDYLNDNVEDFSTSLISYDVISTLEKANEVKYEIGDYRIKTIIPIEINNDNIVYEKETIDEENDFYKMYSISQDDDSVYYNNVIKLGNDVDVNSFLNIFEQQTYLDWQYFLSDIFIPIKDENDNVNVVFSNDENFITMYLDSYMEITYFNNSYKGLLVVSIDKYDGTIIYTFVGYTNDVLSNEVQDDNFSRINLLNSVRNMYQLQYIGEERNGCI